MIRYIVGDVRDKLAELPDGSVDLVASSPPFLALRSYLPADHESKHAEIGSEPDPATFIDTLLGLTAEWGRVLAPHGSIAIELGDTYSGVGGTSTTPNPAYGAERFMERATGDLLAAGNGWRKAEDLKNWPRAKSLALIPQLYAIGLAYGINPITGRPSPAGQWLVRNVIVWHRPNPAVGALGDKYRPSTSYIVVATRSPKRWFDLTAVRTTPTIDPAKMMPGSPSHGAARAAAGLSPFGTGVGGNPAGAPPLDAWFDQHDTWTVTTQPSRLAHYAMWPPKLAERLVLSMCPQRVCTVCGEPSRRVEQTGLVAVPMTRVGLASASRGVSGGDSGNPNKVRTTASTSATIGWTDCGHDAWRNGVTLDPFAGTGTTLCVADLHGRDGWGIDLNPYNATLVDARMNEVRRALFGTKPEMTGQLSMEDLIA